MKNKLLPIIVVIALLLNLTGCLRGSETKNDNKDDGVDNNPILNVFENLGKDESNSEESDESDSKESEAQEEIEYDVFEFQPEHFDVYFEGYDGSAIANISVIKSSVQSSLYEVMGYEENSNSSIAYDKFLEFYYAIEINADNTIDLSNGDVITVEIVMDEELLDRLGIKLSNTKVKYTVTDLEMEQTTEVQKPVVENYGSGKIKIWAPYSTVALTQEYAERFIESNSAYSGYTITVEAMGEGDAATNILTGTAPADIYTFAQDQLACLVDSLTPLTGTSYESFIVENNDAGSVSAAKVGDDTYAFPITSDNGYFLYYDKSVVKDPSTLEGILDQCEAAGKSFYFDLDNTWYLTSFFFATGANISYETDVYGNFTNCMTNWNSDAGLVAYKECVEMVSHNAYGNSSTSLEVPAAQIGAIVTGTWESYNMREILGDNYACDKLPTFTGSDGKKYQMGGFSGCKLIGVKPQEELGKMIVCLELAQYLSSEEVQLARYYEVGFGPSNINAQKNEEVQKDAALVALGKQFPYMTPQGKFPPGFWDIGEALATEVLSKNVTPDSSDEDLVKNLQEFDKDCKALVQ